MSESYASAPEDWRRTSPLSFLVRAIMGLRNLLFPAVAVMFGSQGWGGGAFVVLSLAAMVLVTWLFTWVAWRHFRYRVGDSDIRVERGLVNRTARSVPYERIQDISLEQKLVARLFGMVEVKFETGAGGKDELTIGYVTAAEADALRETVRARKSGQAAEVAETGEAAPKAEEPSRTLFAMDLRRLATFGLFEFSLVVFAVLGGALQQFDFLLPFDIWNFESWIELLAGPGHRLQELGLAAQAIGAALALAVLGILGLVTGLGRTVLRDYGFLLEDTPKGLRRRRGLLTRTDTVMPVHRVQALKVTTRILRRRFGWHALEVVSLASDAKSGSQVVVPFAQMSEIAPVIRVAGFDLPDAITHWHRPSPRYRRDRAVISALPFALAAALQLALGPLLPAEAAGWYPLVAAGLGAMAVFMAVREHFLSRHDRHAIDGERIYARRGWLAPRLDIASRVKLQSVEIAQGPIARRRGYAELKFGVAGGTLEIGGILLEDARLIRDGVLHSIAGVDFSRLPG